jgi:hypothetical protein
MKKPAPKDNPFRPEKISLENMQLTRFEVSASNDFVLDDVNGYKVQHGIELAFNIEDKRARVDFKLQVTSTSNLADSGVANGNFEIVFIYKVGNLDELAAQESTGKLIINAALSSSLASISFSTSRGILLTRCYGTALQNFVLPIVNPGTLLQKSDM